MARQRDNLKAGIFVLFGIVLIVVVIFVLTDLTVLFEGRQIIKVAFDLKEGLHGLKPGSSVTLGDEPIGRVTAIHNLTETGADGQPQITGMLVFCQIPDRYHIYHGADIELAEPLLGSDTKLNIRSVGDGKTPYSASAPAPDDRIEATEAASIRRLLEESSALAANLRKEIPELTDRAKRVLDEAEPAIKDLRLALADAKATAADARVIIADARAHSPEWMKRIDRVTLSADQTLTQVQTLVKDKDPSIRQTIDNVHEITDTVRQKTLAQVTTALDRANDALENLKQTAKDARGLVAGQRPILERTIANAELTTDELKLAAIEIRRSPWRLLYHPGDKELSTDNLYDAARSFALAASMLESASDSLHAVVVAQPEDRPQIKKLVEDLDARFKRFEKAEEIFWNALKDQPGPGSPDSHVPADQPYSPPTLAPAGNPASPGSPATQATNKP